ncbi:MAG TPA: deoxyribonuclease V [Anaerolineae bacterium]|nr:deoxyribonuclease V [Anaerolineae bacterium]HID84080.1 deoxyribonuclease V [Anaerolineales bacterium]HIQ08331.1 deoxyribonuclease V [Anaerolineaceae bacterium]
MDWPLTVDHPWDLSPDQAEALQRRLAARVRSEPLAWTQVRFVAGLDAAYPQGKIRAAVAVLSFPKMDLVDVAVAEVDNPAPYMPGLLSFREAPALLRALARLRVRPNVLLVDGHGWAHPRRLGIASHIGVLLDWPTVGVAKAVLVGRPAGPLADEVGATVPLLHQGEVVAMGVRTRQGVKPVWVSVGHRVDLSSAVALVLRCGRGYRLPEPLRWAHRVAGGQPPPQPPAARRLL